MNTSPHDPVWPIAEPKNSYYEWRGMGLSKREFFAALALQGMLSACLEGNYYVEHIARLAILAADELILQLNKREKDEQTCCEDG